MAAKKKTEKKEKPLNDNQKAAMAAIKRSKEPMTVGALAEKLGIANVSAWSVLNSLHKRGMVKGNKEKGFQVSAAAA